jgi:hypothetical protein
LVPEEEALVQDEHEDEDKEKISIELQNIRDVCSNIISSLSRLDELLNLD